MKNALRASSLAALAAVAMAFTYPVQEQPIPLLCPYSLQDCEARD